MRTRSGLALGLWLLVSGCGDAGGRDDPASDVGPVGDAEADAATGGTGGAGGVPAGGMGGEPDAAPPRYHPVDYAAATVHAPELKLGLQDCRECHGATLEGGTGPSCDTCHPAEWRSQCTFCHGGADSASGAPPRDLGGATAREELTFRAHTEHTSERNHAAWDCNQCHTKPVDVMSDGHVFDDTPAASEVVFSGGLSPDGTYDGEGGCANLYCHGTGRRNGAYDHTEPRPDCNGCHPRATLGGRHREHLREGLQCGECHAETAEGLDTIATPANHVNGVKDVAFTAAGFRRENGACSGSCHLERHANRRW